MAKFKDLKLCTVGQSRGLKEYFPILTINNHARGTFNTSFYETHIKLLKKYSKVLPAFSKEKNALVFILQKESNKEALKLELKGSNGKNPQVYLARTLNFLGLFDAICKGSKQKKYPVHYEKIHHNHLFIVYLNELITTDKSVAGG